MAYNTDCFAVQSSVTVKFICKLEIEVYMYIIKKNHVCTFYGFPRLICGSIQGKRKRGSVRLCDRFVTCGKHVLTAT